MFGNTKVIKNDVKWICDSLKENEKWKDKIEENVGKCPAEERIDDLENYDKGQNAKIDKVSSKVSNLTGKISVWGYILTGIIVVCTILTTVLWMLDSKKAHGEELQQDQLECGIPIEERVEEYIEIWNEVARVKESDVYFDFKKEDGVYILQIKNLNICLCSVCLPTHEEVLLSISGEWLMVANSRRVDGINRQGIIMIYVDSKGKFKTAGKVIL